MRWLYAHLDRFARLARRPVLGRRGGGHQGTAASVEARSGAGAASCSQCAVCEQIETRGSGCNGRLGVNKDLLGRARSPCSERAGRGGRLAVPVVLATRKQSIEQAPVACQARASPAASRQPGASGMASVVARSVWQGRQCFSSAARPHKRARGALRVQATSWVSARGMQPHGLIAVVAGKNQVASTWLPAVGLICRRCRRLPPPCIPAGSGVRRDSQFKPPCSCPALYPRTLRGCSRPRRSRA